MSNIANLGNNNGHIIVQRPDSTTVITSFSNSIHGVKEVINHALAAGVIVGNVAAHGSIIVDDLTGMALEDVTAITINGNNQIGANVTVGAHTLATYAAALRDAINSFTPGAGPNYSASSVENVVTVNDLASNGSTNNGSAISLSKTNPGILTTEAPIDNGSESDTPQDQTFGYKYVLNSTPGSDADDFAGGEEITQFIVMRGMQSLIDTQTVAIGLGATAFTLSRTMVTMNILLNATGGPETIDTIGTNDFSLGDQILLSNKVGAPVVTITEGGNIELANGIDFLSGDPEVVLALKLTDVSGTLKWTEIFRAPNIVISVASMRAVGIAQPANSSTEIVMIAGGQVVAAPVAGTDPGYIRVTGSPALTGAFVMTAPSGSPLGADKFIVDYKATPTDAGGSVIIYGKTFSSNEFVDGKTRIEARYEINAASWAITKIQDSDGFKWITATDIDDDAIVDDKILALAVIESKINTGAVTNSKIGVAAVTPNTANTAMKRRVVTYPVSWETAGLGVNIATQFGGKGTVVKMIVSVTLLVEATDDGSVTFFNTTGASTIGVVTVPATTARGVSVVSTTFTDPTFDDGDILTISTAKVTAGGEATITLIYDATE